MFRKEVKNGRPVEFVKVSFLVLALPSG